MKKDIYSGTKTNGQMKKKEQQTIDLSDWTEIVIETDEDCPKTIVRITPEDPFEIVANGVRIRATPKYA